MQFPLPLLILMFSWSDAGYSEQEPESSQSIPDFISCVRDETLLFGLQSNL